MPSTKAQKVNAWKYLPRAFAQQASLGAWTPYPHLCGLSDYIAKGIVERNNRFRLIVSMPPRHGKSELMSHWLPTWFLEMFPGKRVILATYGDQFATKWGREVRNELRENKYCTTKLASDKEAASNFYTEPGGGMLSAGIRGGITGEGADLMIVDDPVKNWEQAQSKNVRDKINDEFEATLNTRLEPGASVVVLMTRWHSQDLAGFANEEYGWEFLRFPAISDGESIANNHLDPRDEEGEPLCPERYDLSDLQDIKNNLSSKMWESLFQQTPIDQQENSLWSYDIIERGDEPQAKFLTRIVVGVDPAVTSNEDSDETGIIVAGNCTDGNKYVLDDQSLRASPSRWADVAVAAYNKWGADTVVAETNQGGDMVEKMIRQSGGNDIRYNDVRATRGKTIRAEPVVGAYERGEVIHTEKFDELESQMVRYSGEKAGESPDRMDALVWAITELQEGTSGGLTWGS